MMKTPIIHEFDVVICGGGPGGSTAALAFVESGLKVAVIEKSNFPREKVCGDGMLSYIPKVLNRISPKFSHSFDNFKEKIFIRDCYISSFNGQTARMNLPEMAFVSPRYYFDNFLYEQAKALNNITYFLEQQIKSIKIDNDQCTIITNKNEVFYSKLILGCDGSTSIVRRQLTNFTIDPAFHIASIRAYYENLKDPPLNTFEFYFTEKHPVGYFWIFPSFENQVNVGFGIFSDKIAKNKIILKNALLDVIEDNPSLKERFKDAKLIDDFKGWSIPVGYSRHPISGNRFMLCGDAASIADPISGEGIGPAMVSGRIAAFHAIRCFKENNFSEKFMKAYDDEIYLKFGRKYLKYQKIVKFFLNQKWIMNFFVQRIKSNNKFSKILFKLIERIFA